MSPACTARGAHAAAAHVALVGEYERGGDLVDGRAGTLVVVADGGDDLGDLLGWHAHVVEYAEGHHRAGERMLVAVDGVADVVHVAGDFGKLRVLSE